MFSNIAMLKMLLILLYTNKCVHYKMSKDKNMAPMEWVWILLRIFWIMLNQGRKGEGRIGKEAAEHRF